MRNPTGRCEYVIFRLPPDLDGSAGLGGWAGCVGSNCGIRGVCLPRPGYASAAAALAPARHWSFSWSPLLCRAYRQIVEFLRGQRSDFALPMDLQGLSDFAVEVLSGLRRIGYGQTCSYGELASSVGRPRASRAVGRVMASNPLPLVFPCHRVVGRNGRLVGFGGGLPQKSSLLALEASCSSTFDHTRPTATTFRVG